MGPSPRWQEYVAHENSDYQEEDEHQQSRDVRWAGRR